MIVLGGTRCLQDGCRVECTMAELQDDSDAAASVGCVVILVEGTRQVGKSYLVHRLLQAFDDRQVASTRTLTASARVSSISDNY
jgi:GTPase SAR1 family protein